MARDRGNTSVAGDGPGPSFAADEPDGVGRPGSRSPGTQIAWTRWLSYAW